MIDINHAVNHLVKINVVTDDITRKTSLYIIINLGIDENAVFNNLLCSTPFWELGP